MFTIHSSVLQRSKLGQAYNSPDM